MFVFEPAFSNQNKNTPSFYSYEYRLACYRRIFTTTQHSTAQSAIHKAAKHVRADQRATAQASRRILFSRYLLFFPLFPLFWSCLSFSAVVFSPVLLFPLHVPFSFLFFELFYFIFYSFSILFRSSFHHFFFQFFFRFFPPIFFPVIFVGLFICTNTCDTRFVRCTFVFIPLLLLKSQKNNQLLELASCGRASTTAHNSTAAQSAMHKAAKHVRADQSVTTQARRQSWREPACRRASAACVLETNEEIKICLAKTIYNQKQLVNDARRIFFQSQYDTALFLLFRTYLFDACMLRPGCFPGAWSSWHLQVIS